MTAATLDVALESGRTRHAANDADGIATLTAKLTTLAGLVVLEQTARYHQALMAALVQAGVPVAVLDLRSIRHSTRSTGELAKSDRVDVHVPAQYAARLQPVQRIEVCASASSATGTTTVLAVDGDFATRSCHSRQKGGC